MPHDPKRCLILFAHGAGAPSSSGWMLRWTELLGALGEVVPFDYPYMAAGRRAPDRLPKLIEAHREALAAARKRFRKRTRVILCGKSMGSRVGCHLSLEEPVDGLVCLGYPLQGIGKTGKLRDEVLKALSTPILFIQGTRDRLCPLELLEPVRKTMSAPSSLHVVETGNHSLEITKTRARTEGVDQAEVEREALASIAEFLDQL